MDPTESTPGGRVPHSPTIYCIFREDKAPHEAPDLQHLILPRSPAHDQKLLPPLNHGGFGQWAIFWDRSDRRARDRAAPAVVPSAHVVLSRTQDVLMLEAVVEAHWWSKRGPNSC